MTKVNIALGLAVVALVITVYGLFGGHVEKALFGSTSCANITCLSGGLRLVTGAGGDFESDVAAVFSSTFKLGASGTAINRVNTGTCYIQPYSATIAASSTAKVDCQGTALTYNITGTATRDTALTGVTTGDFVQALLSTTTALSASSNGLTIVGASASSTPGYIELYVSNLTGAIYTWPTTGNATGTVSYLVTN